MSLTELQRAMLSFVDEFHPNGPHAIVEKHRSLWAELVQLGLIEPQIKFCLTDLGRAALAQSVEKK